MLKAHCTRWLCASLDAEAGVYPPFRKYALHKPTFSCAGVYMCSVCWNLNRTKCLGICPNFFGGDNGARYLQCKGVAKKHVTVAAFHVCLGLNQRHFFELRKLQICVKQLKGKARWACTPFAILIKSTFLMPVRFSTVHGSSERKKGGQS